MSNHGLVVASAATGSCSNETVVPRGIKPRVVHVLGSIIPNDSNRYRWIFLNLQQLRYLCAVVDHGLNVSDAAEALFTSQPGISKQIRQLEDELGLSVFVRQGKRLASLTPAGEIVVATARRAMREIANLKRVADEFRGEDTGTLS